jgi:hypothetical protein
LFVQLPVPELGTDAVAVGRDDYRLGAKGESFPWAVLSSDFSELLDWGLVKWDTAVVVSLGGEERMQMSGNRVWVGRGG